MTDDNGGADLVSPPRPAGNSSNGGTASAPSSGNLPGKAAAQVQKMKDANAKYKNLLMMAKERIEQQEEELRRLRGTSPFPSRFSWMTLVGAVLPRVLPSIGADLR
jgi:hypothetical protein